MNIALKFRFPDTGQSRCYDNDGNEITPPGKGESLHGQNGCFIINPSAFTKLGDKGRELPDSATWEQGLRMVLDNNTGLVWEIKSPRLDDANYCLDKYSWHDARDAYLAKLNSSSYGGFNDWRLPNKDELRSIIDYSKTNPAIDTWNFPHCQTDFYWSGITYAMQPEFAWGIFFGLGSGIAYGKSNPFYVRAVREGYNREFGDPDKVNLKDNGDGSITDLNTGLMWQKDENERMSWNDALDYCQQTQLAGYRDWRLPNIRELNTILNLNYRDGWWYHRDFFPAEGLAPPLLHYFSSTTYNKYFAWVTNFCFGYDGYYANKKALLLFRPVRNITSAQKIQVHFRLPDSGQNQCYDDQGNQIAAPAVGEKFYGQDASYIIHPISCTRLRTDGKEVESAIAWEQGLRMVRDNNTGLIWEIKSPLPEDINFQGNLYNLEEAQEFVDSLNRTCHEGFSDWRLPNREELRSIVDYNGEIPCIDTGFFPDCIPEFYWSCDTYFADPKLVWGIYFAYGCAICYLKTARYHVRAVRGGYNRAFGDVNRYSFKDNFDGTISDLNTGLIWKKEEGPDLNCADALKYCEDLKLAGHADWRLPNIRELATLLDLSYTNGTWFHEAYFPDVQTTPLGFYWSSTTHGHSFGWGINFQFGYDGYYAGKKHGRYAFRPVRGKTGGKNI